MGHAKKLDLSRELLLEMYSKMTIVKIAEELGVSEKTIRRRFKEYNIETGIHTPENFKPRNEPKKKKVKEKKPYENREEFQSKYLETKSLVLVAKHFNISPDTALKWKKRHNIETVVGVSEYSKSQINARKPYANKDWLEEAYQNNTIREIADSLGVHEDTIKVWIKRHNIRTRTVAEQRAFKSGNGNRTILSTYTNKFSLKNYMDYIPYNLPTSIRSRIISTIGKCQVCGYNEVLDLHHIDENHHNNHPSNHAVLCPNCHAKVHRLKMKLPPIQSWASILDGSYNCGH